jgi:hypothetical protein
MCIPAEKDYQMDKFETQQSFSLLATTRHLAPPVTLLLSVVEFPASIAA